MTPPAQPEAVDPGAWEVVVEISQRLVRERAQGVILTGSHARGTAVDDSDVDLYALGDGPSYRLERAGRFLVSTSWTLPSSVEESFRDPLACGATVPAWRQAIVVLDGAGIASRLRSVASEWDWTVVGDAACDAVVAEELCGYAEEVHKLVTNIARGRMRVAAVQRSILALRLARIMTLHLRILYESEDDLWNLVADRLGSDWARAQSMALSEHGESLTESCAAALELFAIASARIRPLFDERQWQVVSYSTSLAIPDAWATPGRKTNG